MTSAFMDPVFPQINEILQPGFMRVIFQNALNRHQVQGHEPLLIEKCDVGEKRYKPGKSFSLSYKLKVQVPSTHESFEQLVSACLCPSEVIAFEKEEVIRHPILSPMGMPVVNFLPDVGMMVWVFPHDRKLVHLPKLLETGMVCSLFNQNPSSLNLSPSEHIASAIAEIVHYLPEQSCMIRYRLAIADTSIENQPAQEEVVVYGKNYSDDTGEKAFAVMGQIAAQSSHCAEPLHYDAETMTLWQSHLPGKPFEWSSDIVKNLVDIHKIATCIAEFHRCKVDISTKFGFTQINRDLAASVLVAEGCNAVLGERVKGMVMMLLSQQGQIDWGKKEFNSPLHLDLKMGNLLVSDDKAYLIDLDCVSLGDPLADIGSFIANLYLNGLRFGSSIPEVDQVVMIFIGFYRDAMRCDIDVIHLNWYIAAALIHEVLRRSLRQQNHERIQQIDTYMAISRRYLALCQEGI